MTINNNINSLYIFQSDEIDSIESETKVLIWNGYQDKPNCTSIPKYLEDNANKFRKKYVEFIHDIGIKNISNKNLTQLLKINKNYNLWWMSLLTEKSHYKSPRIKDCLKLFALEEILIKNKPSEIILYFSDKDVSEAIKKLSKNLGIKFILKKISSRKNHKYKSILHYIYFKSPYILQAFVYLFKIVFIHWPLKKTYKTKWFDEKKAIFFSSYLFHLDYTKFKEGEYKTGQWGPITELLKELSIKSNWLHHFLPSAIIPNTKVGINFINKLNNNPNTNGFHQFVFNYLNFKIILKVIFNYIKLILKLISFVKFKDSFKPDKSNICFWPLLKKDFINSILGSKSIENLLWIELFDSAMKKIPHQKKGIYLQENQAWEKAFITSWKNHKHGKLMGLNNGFVRFWDTRFFDDTRTIEDSSDTAQPIPDQIILCDRLSWNSYIEAGYPINKLLKAETIRYFDVIAERSEKKNNFLDKKNKFNALILGDIVFKTTDNMIRNIEKTTNKENFNWTIKAHPACPLNIQNYKKVKLNTCHNNLKDVISKFNVVISSAATLAILEAYLSNINIIIFLEKDELNLSPLKGFPEINVVHDFESMNQALNKKNINNYEHKKDNFFWFDRKLTLWRKILI